jgi:hypothetical protein
MRWTKRHSVNAVAAKARKRMAEPDFSNEPRRKVRVPRGRIRFTLTLEDHQIGDKIRLGLFALPWRGRFVSTDGQQLSAAKIISAVNTVLCHE